MEITRPASPKQLTVLCEYCGKELEVMKFKLPWKTMTIVPACECVFEMRKQQKQAEKKWEMMEILKRRGFQSGKYARMTFDNFDNDKLFTDVIASVSDYMNSVNFAKRNWLYLYGEWGLGKTHIGIAATRQLALARLWQPAFLRWTEYCSLIQQSWHDKGVKVEWHLGREAQILLLDDIDKKSATPWALGELYEVLNFRDVSELPTIITANRNILELANFWNKNKETEELGKTIISRILGQVSKIIQFQGADYRLYG